MMLEETISVLAAILAIYAAGAALALLSAAICGILIESSASIETDNKEGNNE